MENIPIYWKTSLGDIEETLKFIQKGKIVNSLLLLEKDQFI